MSSYKMRKTQENFLSWQQLHIILIQKTLPLGVLGQKFTPKISLLGPSLVIFQLPSTKLLTLSVSLIKMQFN